MDHEKRMNRSRVALTAAEKGKGICYENPDEPIQLSDEEDAPTIRDFRLSLIGKVLNPKKQIVEKLIQTMPATWGMQDKITANDLGSGKFLLNFENETDLKSVLSQGPFHYNFCMFVLVRWEPVVHDDYPWVIPFWVEITGIPLHFWTIKNLKNIGSRLGHIDTVDLSAGRMLIDVDTRKPLTFSRKIASKDGDEVTIQIHYDKLFKHCKTCGMLTHEQSQCLTQKPVTQDQSERTRVFARVQLPWSEEDKKEWFNGHKQVKHEMVNTEVYYQRNRATRDEKRPEGGFMTDARRSYGRQGGYNDRYDSNRGGKERKSSHQNARYAPYVKNRAQIWKAKERTEVRYGSNDRRDESYAHRFKPAEGTVRLDETIRDDDKRDTVIRSGRGETRTTTNPRSSTQQDKEATREDATMETVTQQTSGKRIASQVVTPIRHDQELDAYVTKRRHISPRLLTFSPKENVPLQNEQIIGALSDKEIIDQGDMEESFNATKMDVDVKEDDLLGDELMDIEAAKNKGSKGETAKEDKLIRRPRSSSIRNGKSRKYPLGIPIRKSEGAN
ncbi:Uncharacterized protein Rs2_21603 [Raphanus sativus]|nr:Uncharacterized protein Rs2_21603 [Raphanus sativus]